MHLQTLVAYGDLTVVRGQGAVGRPNIYLITRQGLRKSGQGTGHMGNDHWRPRRRPTGCHGAHELLITEIAVLLAETVRARPNLNLRWTERFGFSGQSAFQQLVPDYGFLFQHNKGLLVCLVEVSSGEESSTRFGQKLRKYAQWGVSPEGQGFLIDLYREHGARTPQPRFRLLFVAENRRTGNDTIRLRQIFAEALRLPRAIQRQIWATTVESLKDTSGVDAPVWMRGADIESAVPRYKSLSRAKRDRFLASVLDGLPKHRLFPPPEETGDAPSR